MIRRSRLIDIDSQSLDSHDIQNITSDLRHGLIYDPSSPGESIVPGIYAADFGWILSSRIIVSSASQRLKFYIISPGIIIAATRLIARPSNFTLQLHRYCIGFYKYFTFHSHVVPMLPIHATHVRMPPMLPKFKCKKM